MKPVLIVYATREGHTKSIAEHVSATLLRRGLFVELGDAGQLSADLDLRGGYGGIIAIASVHGGLHEREMVAFVRRHRSSLERMPAAFLSVSLAQAASRVSRTSQQRAHAAAKVQSAIERFRDDTGWTAPVTLPVAGALPYRRYKRLLRFVMRWVARAHGLPFDSSRDYAWTDWPELDHFANAFAEGLEPRTATATRSGSM